MTPDKYFKFSVCEKTWENAEFGSNRKSAWWMGLYHKLRSKLIVIKNKKKIRKKYGN